MTRALEGLTKDDVPPEISVEAAKPFCEKHPDGPSRHGFGYAGGGFGPYRVCKSCNSVFGKLPARDGNEP